MPESDHFDRMAAAFRQLPEDEQISEWENMTIREQEEMGARSVRPGTPPPSPEPSESPTARKPRQAKASVQEKFAQVLNTDALSPNQKELIDSLELDAENLSLEALRDLAHQYNLPEDQAKLARAAAEEKTIGDVLTGQSYEPSPEELEAAAKPVREGVEEILTEEYGPDGRKRSTYRGSKAKAE